MFLTPFWSGPASVNDIDAKIKELLEIEQTTSFMNHGNQLFFAALFELSLGLLAVGLGNLWGTHPNSLVPRPTDIFGLGVGLIGGAVLGLVMVAVVQSLEKFDWAWIEETSSVAEKSLGALLKKCSILHMIALSLAAGVGEEMLFRGWLQGTLIDRWQPVFGTTGVWIAILVSSLIFGMAHPLSRGYVAVAFALGLVLGSVAWSCGNLLIANIAHSTYDAALMVIFAKKWRQKTS